MKYQIIDTQKAHELRQEFIKKFINTKAEHYHEHIEVYKQYSDGMCYDGYLWDFLKENKNYEKQQSMKNVLAYLAKQEEAYVMWDIYSNERVRDGSKLATDYPKGTIIRAKGAELAQLIAQEWENGPLCDHLLPEDFYCFSNDAFWYTIFTHEEIDNSRVCFLDDWRLRWQEDYLKNVSLYHIPYEPLSAEWDHEHCEFCWAKFFLDGKNLEEGYCTQPNNNHDAYWICTDCFEDFKDLFSWKLENLSEL